MRKNLIAFLSVLVLATAGCSSNGDTTAHSEPVADTVTNGDAGGTESDSANNSGSNDSDEPSGNPGESSGDQGAATDQDQASADQDQAADDQQLLSTDDPMCDLLFDFYQTMVSLPDQVDNGTLPEDPMATYLEPLEEIEGDLPMLVKYSLSAYRLVLEKSADPYLEDGEMLARQMSGGAWATAGPVLEDEVRGLCDLPEEWPEQG